MPTTEERIFEKLDQIFDRTARLEERVTGLSDRIDKYNNVTGRMGDVEKELSLQRQACETVQSQKKEQRIPAGNLKAAVISGVSVGLIMILFNLLVSYFKT